MTPLEKASEIIIILSFDIFLKKEENSPSIVDKPAIKLTIKLNCTLLIIIT